MNAIKTYLLIAILACVSACGRQVVEFQLADAGELGCDARTDGPHTDGSIDGSTIDASLIDASLIDASLIDASMVDASLIDASLIDASLIDASMVDASMIDASMIDAMIDASPIDAMIDGPTNAPPTVIATLPPAGAMNVSLTTNVMAMFDKPMNPATITNLTFTPIVGTVTLNVAGTTATFTPAAPLVGSLVYTGTITTGARDTGGMALAADYVWMFTTGGGTAPTVTSTVPLSNAMNVPIASNVTATFSTSMNGLTLNSTTFTLAQGLTPITGLVTYDGPSKTAKFDPTVDLTTGLIYTATITTGAQDTGGTGLAMAYTWQFTTGSAVCAQAPITLGTAANFAVLAGSTVTNTGLSTVTGNLGVSPGTAVTGFPPGILVGMQFTGVGSAAGTAIADLTTAYNEAAGRALCAVTVAGNLGGQTLPPGLYKSTSFLEITSGDLTLDGQGDVNAVWVFQMASTMTTTINRQVLLTNGASAANVYWQVGTSATLGISSVFQGTIMADQTITLNTGTKLNGRALARIAAVTLNASTVVKP